MRSRLRRGAVEQRIEVCGVVVALRCAEAALANPIRSLFEALQTANAATEPTLLYDVSRDPDGDVITVSRLGCAALTAASLDELLFLLDKDLTVALQHQRSDLFFVHAGVVEYGGRAWVISAPSGTGKSTTVWALVRDGLGYVSDELAPIEVTSDARVHPYPRALHIKREPGAPYGVPANVMRFPEGLYIPTAAMPRTPQTDALPLCGMFFLRRDAERNAPRTKHLSPAEAASHLYANALNPLAHAGMGLDAAIAIAERVPCLEVELGPLSASVAEIQRCMHEAVG